MEKRQPDEDVKRLLIEVTQWNEKITKPTIWKKAGNLVSKPIGWAIDKLPDFVGIVLAKSIEGLFGVLVLTSNYTFKTEWILKRVTQNGGSNIVETNDLWNQPISSLSKTARFFLNENRLIGLLEGGGCGLGGVFLIFADIPALFGICFRVIQMIGTTFGFDMESPLEKQLMMRIIDFSSSAPTAAKVQAMFNKEALLHYIKAMTIKEVEAVAAVKAGEIALEDVARQLLKQQGKRATQKAINEMASKLLADATKNGQKAAAIVAARQAAKDVGKNLTKKKIAQLIPILGGVVGAGFNYWFVSRVAESAYYFYLKRHIDQAYEVI